MEKKGKEIKRLLASSEEAERKQGIFLLAKISSKKSLVHLQKIAEDDVSVDIRFFARKAVAFVKASLKPKVIDQLPDKNLSSLNWPKATVDEKLALIQFSINNNLKNNLRFFIGILQKEPDVQVKSALIMAIGKFGEENVIDVLIPFLEHDSPRIRANTIEALEFIGSSKARAFALSRLEDPDNRVRANAVKVAKDLAPAKILQVVEGMLASSKPAMQASGAFILQFLPGEKNALLLESVLNSPHTAVKENAIATLKKFREKNISSAEELFQRFNIDGKTNETPLTIDILQSESEFALPTLEVSFDGLLSTNPEDRLKTLCQIYDGGENAEKAIFELLKTEQNAHVFAKALILIGNLHLSAGIPQLIANLNNEDDRSRANAVQALGMFGDDLAAQHLVPYLNDPNNRVRANAIIALRNVPDCDLVTPVEEMVNSTQEMMKKSVIFAISTTKRPEFYNYLERLEESGDPEISNAAKKARATYFPLDSDDQSTPGHSSTTFGYGRKSASALFPEQFHLFKDSLTEEKFEQAVRTATQIIQELWDKVGPETEKKIWYELLSDAFWARGNWVYKKALAQIPRSILRAWSTDGRESIDPEGNDQRNCVLCAANLAQGFIRATLYEKSFNFCFQCGEPLEKEEEARQKKTISAVSGALGDVLAACEIDGRKTLPERHFKVAENLSMFEVSSLPTKPKLRFQGFEEFKGLLDRPEPEIRVFAAISLGDFGAQAKTKIPEILEILSDALPWTKNALLNSIRKIASDVIPGKLPPELIKGLIQLELDLILSPAIRVRRESLEWLMFLDPNWKQVPEVKEKVQDILREMEGGSTELKIFLIKFLQKLGKDAEEVVPNLLNVLLGWEKDLIEPIKIALKSINPQWAMTDAGNGFLKTLTAMIPKESEPVQIEMLAFIADQKTLKDEIGEKIEKLPDIIPSEVFQTAVEQTLMHVYPAGFANLKKKTRKKMAKMGISGFVGLIVFSIVMMFFQFFLQGDKTAGYILYKVSFVSAKKLVKALKGDLTASDIRKRLDSTGILGKMGKDAEEALPMLIDNLFSKDDELRENTNYALSRISSTWHKSNAARKAISHLIPMLTDKDPKIRNTTKENLAKIDQAWHSTPEAQAAIPELIALWCESDLQATNFSEELVKKIAVDWTSMKEAEKTLNSLEKACQSLNVKVRKNSVQILGKMAKTETSAIPLLIKSMIDTDDEVRQGAEEGLKTYSEQWLEDEKVLQSLPAILNKLANNNQREMALTVSLLGRFGKKLQAVVPQILIEMEKVPAKKTTSFFQVLEKSGPGWVFTEEAQKTLQIFQGGLADASSETRISSLACVKQFKRGALAAMQAVAPLLLDPVPEIRVQAGETLKAIDSNWGESEAVQTIFPAIRKNLQSDDPSLQELALNLVTKFGKGGLRILPDVIVLFATNPSVERRDAIEKNLQSILPEWMESDQAASAVPDLLKAFPSAQQDCRWVILQIFEKLGPKAGLATDGLKGFVNDENCPQRLEIIKILGKMGPNANSAAPELKKLINHSSFDVRKEAIVSLEKIIPGWDVTKEMQNGN